MNDRKVVTTQRRGGKYEAIGFLVMVLGLALLLAVHPLAGLALLGLGFGVAIVGRCL
jgi:hypothetical protein